MIVFSDDYIVVRKMTEYLRFLMEPARIGMLSLEIRIYHPCQPLDPKNVVFQPLNHGWVYAAFRG